MGARAEALAARIEDGARVLAEVAEGLSAADWAAEVAGEGRSVGVLIHHVAAGYEAEAGLIGALIGAQDVSGVTWAVVDQMNADQARANAGGGREEALDLLRRNSAQTAALVRGLDDAQLDRVASTALHWGAPLTVQFFIEQHPVAHPHIHLESIRAALGR